MKKLTMLTTAAGILLALAGPTLAAQRTYRATDAYASGSDRSGAYSYGPVEGDQSYGAQARTPAQYDRTQYNRGPNLPYPDRPYGAPDHW